MNRWFLILLMPLLCRAQDTTLRTQTISLHPGWNLVSLNLWPDRAGEYQMLQISDVLNKKQEWFFRHSGRLYTGWNNQHGFPEVPDIAAREWFPYYAYYIYLDNAATWSVTGTALQTDSFEITPTSAWDRVNANSNIGWFFCGYGTHGREKLASVPIHPKVASGDPAQYSYLGPLHWLIWQDDPDQGYPSYTLKIVKTDEGRVYFPAQQSPDKMVDQIGFLEPGEGYLLGFVIPPEKQFMFRGWPEVPTWTGATGKSSDRESPNKHFKHHRYSQWSYPILVEAVDRENLPLEIGDEIGAFCNGICVGAATYQGDTPFVITAWEKDRNTGFLNPDGYFTGYPIDLIWYSASGRTECKIKPPPADSTGKDHLLYPKHSGFGIGFLARRSLEDLSWVRRLPRSLELSGCFPHPVDSTTLVRFNLPERAKVILEIYNTSGKLLGRPYETTCTAGSQAIRWDATKLTDGIYFYRVTGEGLEREGKYQSVGKLLLLK
jgi:hypothetical protein